MVNFDRKSRFFGVRPPSKLVCIGAKSALRKFLRYVTKYGYLKIVQRGILWVGGESNGANALIASFLNKHIQSVNVNGIFSDWIEIKRGVPQGTVLGPLLFNLYVNDIQERLYEGCTLVQYAEDCMVFSSSIISEDALK